MGSLQSSQANYSRRLKTFFPQPNVSQALVKINNSIKQQMAKSFQIEKNRRGLFMLLEIIIKLIYYPEITN